MARRITDTAKWQKEWYRKLGSRLRDIRQYLLDTCDHAGIWQIDYETASHFIGDEVTENDVINAFRGNVVAVETSKFFFPDFVEFQYNCSVNELNPANRVHLSVINMLNSLAIDKGLTSPFQGAKNNNKDKDKDKDRKNLKLAPPTDPEVESLDALFIGIVGEVLYRRISLATKKTWLALYGHDLDFVVRTFVAAVPRFTALMPAKQNADVFFSDQLKFDYPHHTAAQKKLSKIDRPTGTSPHGFKADL